MTHLRHSLRNLALAAFAAVCFELTSPAFGADRGVDLRLNPTAHGVITLGDIFEGLSTSSARVEVIRAPLPGLQAVLEADEIQALARRNGIIWANTTGLHHIIVTSLPGQAAAAARRMAISPSHTAGRNMSTLVYSRNMSAGEIVQAADLEWSDQATIGDSLGEPDLAIGKAARRPLRAGSPVQLYDLLNPKVIHRDQMVDVAYETEGITLTLEGKAMADAAVGDPVDIINLSSKKVISAVASGLGKAVIGPRAEQLRASTFDPRLRTAALN
jgi:flagella basal body P-ring formation protein FlgA